MFFPCEISFNASFCQVGHSVQRDGISPACDASVWRIDVGMSKGVLATSPQVSWLLVEILYHADPQVLEIKQDGSVNILGKSI